MKEKKVGDKIIFDYDVYDVVNNIEYEYDYTATLAGIVTEVIPSDRGGYTKYKVKITKLLCTEGEKYFEPGNIIEASDDKVYRGGALHNVLYKDKCPQPTPQQIERIIEMYDDTNSLEDNLKYITKEWYKYGLDKFGLYDEDENPLFEKALEWYQSGDKGKKEAALDIFPQDMLEKEIENHRKKKERLKREERDNVLANVLIKSKELFPIGTLVWSDEGTDYCPNIIVSEPYIGTNEYGNHIPYDAYDYNTPPNERKTVLAKTFRLFRGEFTNERWSYGIVGLENLIHNMNSDSKWVNHKPIVNLEEYYKNEIENKKKRIEQLKDNIERTQKELDKYNEELSELESYNPRNLTKEKVQSIIEQYT